MSFISAQMYIFVYILCRFIVINLPNKKQKSSMYSQCKPSYTPAPIYIVNGRDTIPSKPKRCVFLNNRRLLNVYFSSKKSTGITEVRISVPKPTYGS